MKVERREFLRLLGFFGAAAVSGQLVIGSEKPQEVPLGKRKLIREIDGLPESPIKVLLLQRIKPYYRLDPPKTVDFGGIEIQIQHPEVRLKPENINQVSGRFTFRESRPSEPLYPTQTTVVKIPYVGLLLDSERAEIPPQNLALDGTPLLEITFPYNRPFYTGFSPLIEVTTPDSSVIKPEYKKLYEVFERFVLIKEACSHLVFDLWVEEMVKKMHHLGFRSKVEARKADGSKATAEIVSQSINEIHNFNDRIVAAIDLAAYAVAFKAAEGTELVDLRYLDENYKKVYAGMRDISLGETPEDILYNSLRWALTTPEARLLHHAGSLDRIP